MEDSLRQASESPAPVSPDTLKYFRKKRVADLEISQRALTHKLHTYAEEVAALKTALQMERARKGGKGRLLSADKENAQLHNSGNTNTIQNLEFEKSELEIALREARQGKAEADRELLKRCAELANLRAVAELSQSKCASVRSANELLDYEVTALGLETDALRAELRRLAEEKGVLAEENGVLGARVDALESAVCVLQSERDALVLAACSERALTERRLCDVSTEAAQHKTAAVSLSRELELSQANAQAAATASQQRESHHTQQLARLQSSVSSRDDKVARLQAEVETLTSRLSLATSEVQALEGRVLMARVEVQAAAGVADRSLADREQLSANLLRTQLAVSQTTSLVVGRQLSALHREQEAGAAFECLLLERDVAAARCRADLVDLTAKYGMLAADFNEVQSQLGVAEASLCAASDERRRALEDLAALALAHQQTRARLCEELEAAEGARAASLRDQAASAEERARLGKQLAFLEMLLLKNEATIADMDAKNGQLFLELESRTDELARATRLLTQGSGEALAVCGGSSPRPSLSPLRLGATDGALVLQALQAENKRLAAELDASFAAQSAMRSDLLGCQLDLQTLRAPSSQPRSPSNGPATELQCKIDGLERELRGVRSSPSMRTPTRRSSAPLTPLSGAPSPASRLNKRASDTAPEAEALSAALIASRDDCAFLRRSMEELHFLNESLQLEVTQARENATIKPPARSVQVQTDVVDDACSILFDSGEDADDSVFSIDLDATAIREEAEEEEVAPVACEVMDPAPYKASATLEDAQILRLEGELARINSDYDVLLSSTNGARTAVAAPYLEMVSLPCLSLGGAADDAEGEGEEASHGAVQLRTQLLGRLDLVCAKDCYTAETQTEHVAVATAGENKSEVLADDAGRVDERDSSACDEVSEEPENADSGTLVLQAAPVHAELAATHRVTRAADPLLELVSFTCVSIESGVTDGASSDIAARMEELLEENAGLRAAMACLEGALSASDSSALEIASVSSFSCQIALASVADVATSTEPQTTELQHEAISLAERVCDLEATLIESEENAYCRNAQLLSSVYAAMARVSALETDNAELKAQLEASRALFSTAPEDAVDAGEMDSIGSASEVESSAAEVTSLRRQAETAEAEKRSLESELARVNSEYAVFRRTSSGLATSPSNHADSALSTDPMYSTSEQDRPHLDMGSYQPSSSGCLRDSDCTRDADVISEIGQIDFLNLLECEDADTVQMSGSDASVTISDPQRKQLDSLCDFYAMDVAFCEEETPSHVSDSPRGEAVGVFTAAETILFTSTNNSPEASPTELQPSSVLVLHSPCRASSSNSVLSLSSSYSKLQEITGSVETLQTSLGFAREAEASIRSSVEGIQSLFRMTERFDESSVCCDSDADIERLRVVISESVSLRFEGQEETDEVAREKKSLETQLINQHLHTNIRLQRREIRKLRVQVDELESERCFLVSETEVAAVQSDLEAVVADLRAVQRSRDELTKEKEQLLSEVEVVHALEEQLSSLREERRVLQLSLATARDNVEFFKEMQQSDRKKLCEQIADLRKKS